MDERLRELERGDDHQAYFDALRRAGKTEEACELVKYHSIKTPATLEYWYSYRFMRNSGGWHDHPSYLARTYEELAPVVAETIRNGYIARSMEITGQETKRGQLIRVPVMILLDTVTRLPCDAEGVTKSKHLFEMQVVRDEETFKHFMRLVIEHRQAKGKHISQSVSQQFLPDPDTLSVREMREALGNLQLTGGRGGSPDNTPQIITGRGGANV